LIIGIVDGEKGFATAQIVALSGMAADELVQTQV
jgi:hypothetical protein